MRYLIFGGTGSLGKKLIERLLPECRHSVHVYSRDEAKHWTIRNEWRNSDVSYNLHFHVGDIRDYERVKSVIRDVNPDRIIVAAALKQVDTCEQTPSESIRTNVIGTLNVVNAISEVDPALDSCLFVSTDKACAPVNVYGMCKALSERIVTSHDWRKVKFLAVRYGNVLESRGSIIPLFRYQAETQEHLTVTDPDMTRYVMTLDEAVDLIQFTFDKGKDGEIWIPRLPSMRIGDLAEIFAEKFNKKVKIVGPRPGEKKHEELINASESSRAVGIGKHYVISSNIKDPDSSECCYSWDRRRNVSNDSTITTKAPETYSSDQNVMTKQQLFERLTSLNIIDTCSDDFKGLAIEEIKK